MLTLLYIRIYNYYMPYLLFRAGYKYFSLYFKIELYAVYAFYLYKICKIKIMFLKEYCGFSILSLWKVIFITFPYRWASSMVLESEIMCRNIIIHVHIYKLILRITTFNKTDAVFPMHALIPDDFSFRN